MKIFYFSQVDLTRSYSGTVHVMEVVNNFICQGNEVWLFAQKTGSFQENCPSFHGIEIGQIAGGLAHYVRYQVALLIKALILCYRVVPDVLYVRSEGAMFSHIILSWLLGIPYFLELNSWPFRDLDKVRSIPSIIMKGTKRLIRASILRSAGIICVTDEIAKRVKRYYGLDKTVHIVTNGANIFLFRPKNRTKIRESLGLNSAEFVLAYVAYFQYYNDVEIVLNAIPLLKDKIPELKVLLVGGWAQETRRREVESLIAKTAPSTVVMAGEIPYEKVPDYINAADICLATFNSDVGDGSVMKVYEYLSCGKPTVGSSISSLQFLKEIDAGDLVPLRDPKALAQAVWRLYLDKTQRDLQSERLRNYIVKYHSWEAVSKKLLNLMRSTLGEHLINKGVKNEN